MTIHLARLSRRLGPVARLVRGSDKVRAKVVDMRNGSYQCTYKPFTSGPYTISVSLFGEQLPGSPFSVFVYHPHPHAPNCEVRGSSLSSVVARNPAAFEISFRDKLGQVAQAVELDVFVELVEAGERPEPLTIKTVSVTRMLHQPGPSINALRGIFGDAPAATSSQSHKSPNPSMRVCFAVSSGSVPETPAPRLMSVMRSKTQSERVAHSAA